MFRWNWPGRPQARPGWVDHDPGRGSPAPRRGSRRVPGICTRSRLRRGAGRALWGLDRPGSARWPPRRPAPCPRYRTGRPSTMRACPASP